MTTRRKKIKKSMKESDSKGFSLDKSKSTLILAGVFLLGIAAYALLGGKADVRTGEKVAVNTQDVKSISLPSYAYKNKKTLEAYTKAAKIPHILEWIPCYCGCGGHSQHKNAKNCFIMDNGNSDPHGADCEMCLDIALSVYDWYTKGVNLQEIRNRIERAYGGRYGESTPTPSVPQELKDFTVDKDTKFVSS